MLQVVVQPLMTAMLSRVLLFVSCVILFAVARCFPLIIMHLLMSLRAIPVSPSVIWYVASFSMIVTINLF